MSLETAAIWGLGWIGAMVLFVIVMWDSKR